MPHTKEKAREYQRRLRAEGYYDWGKINDKRYFGGNKATVLERDNHKCRLCDGQERLQVHHKDGNRNNNNLGNLIALCGRCHARTHHTGRFAAHDKDKLEKLWVSGRPIQEIAAIFDVQRHTIRRWVRHYGLPTRCKQRDLKTGLFIWQFTNHPWMENVKKAMNQ